MEAPNEGEDRILVKSPKVATYDLKPEMSAYEVCDRFVEAIKSGKYDVIITNFANPDMVGHTGVEPAAIKAIEAVDECVGRVVEALKEADGQMFICADHGNAEQLVDYEDKRAFHGPYYQPGSLYSGELRQRLYPAGGRLPGGYCSHPD